MSQFLNIMVSADVLKKAAICGATVSVIGAAFFHHRIQGEQKPNGRLAGLASSRRSVSQTVAQKTGLD